VSEEPKGYEYRPVKRVKGSAGEWKQIYTGNGRDTYITRGGAKTVLGREERNDSDNARWWDPEPTPEYEYKIQRRPFGEWEDFE
jgi:hypothetical protein